ncbi:MAG: MGMT family protein [Patescibacteria group bacterium]
MLNRNFKDRVLNIVRKIPKGKTFSYKQVASLAGSSLASRAVGNIMKNNKDKSVPCHRVIKSDGTLGGYNGLKGEKERLLKKEGVKFPLKS